MFCMNVSFQIFCKRKWFTTRFTFIIFVPFMNCVYMLLQTTCFPTFRSPWRSLRTNWSETPASISKDTTFIFKTHKGKAKKSAIFPAFVAISRLFQVARAVHPGWPLLPGRGTRPDRRGDQRRGFPKENQHRRRAAAVWRGHRTVSQEQRTAADSRVAASKAKKRKTKKHFTWNSHR